MEDLVDCGLYKAVRELDTPEAKELMRIFESDRVCLFGDTAAETLQAAWREMNAPENQKYIAATGDALKRLIKGLPPKQQDRCMRIAYELKKAARV